MCVYNLQETSLIFISKKQPGVRHSDPLKSSSGSHSPLVNSFWRLHSQVIASMLPLLLSIHLELVTVLDYSQ